MGRTAADLWGTEHDWLACDVDGCVAGFSTAGGGYAPESYARDVAAPPRPPRSWLDD